MTFTFTKLVNPSESELEAVINVSTAAFVDSDATAVLLGRSSSLLREFCRAQVVATSLAGEIYVARAAVGSNEIVGCALWYAPGREMYDSEDQKEQALVPLLSKLSSDIQTWWNEVFLPGYQVLVKNTVGPEVIKNAWHLQLVGTVPEARGKGVARGLINEVRNKAGGALLCLETPTEANLEIYRRIGFQTEDEHCFFSNDYGSFNLYMMTAESSK